MEEHSSAQKNEARIPTQAGEGAHHCDDGSLRMQSKASCLHSPEKSGRLHLCDQETESHGSHERARIEEVVNTGADYSDNKQLQLEVFRLIELLKNHK